MKPRVILVPAAAALAVAAAVLLAPAPDAATAVPARADAGKKGKAKKVDPKKRGDKKKPAARPPKGQLTPEQEKELLAFVKKSRPDYHPVLVGLKKKNPAEYWKAVRPVWRFYQGYKRMSPEMRKAVDAEQKAKIEIGKLVGRYRNARNDSDRKKLADQLRKQLIIQFDAELRIRRLRLEEMMARLKAQIAGLDGQKKKRDKTVGDRLARWIREATKPARKTPKQR